VAEEASVLADLALFEDCSPEDLDHLASAIAGVHVVPEGSVVCREGEIADRWWIVVDGLAEVTVGGLYVATIGPGESIGELALLDAQPRSATVTASADMVVHEVDGALFLELLASHPRISLALLRQVAVRLRITSEQSARPAWNEPVPRLAPSGTRPGITDVTFNPFAPGYFSDPYEQYGLLREFDPVHLDRLTGAYVITRFEDVRRLARDRSMSVGTAGATPSPVIQAEIARDRAGGGSIPRMMLRRDGEDHSRLRHLVAKAFTPKAIAAWRQQTEAVADRLLSELADRDVIDVIEDFAAVFPAQIISDMLGMPPADLPQVSSWSQALTKAFDPLNSPHEEAAFIEASRCLSEYVESTVAAKRNRPGEDILSSLIAAEEHGNQLSHEELVAQVILLYVAGYENALNLVGNGLVHLFEFPAQLHQLRNDPSLDANAIEEIIRFDSPVQFARRVTVEVLEIHGVTIPSGSVLLLGLGAANRDPDKWGVSADLLELARPRAHEHASFGGGPHHCLGSSLARLEAQVALPRLVRKFPQMVPDDHPVWSARMVVRGVERLSVRLRDG